MVDTEGFARTDDWSPGDVETKPPNEIMSALINTPKKVSKDVSLILDKSSKNESLSEGEIIRLFQARGDDFSAVTQAADTLRQ